MSRLEELHQQKLLPNDHVSYLWNMKKSDIMPSVIYDIGACVMHWTDRAKEVWPDAEYYLFEAMEESAHIFDKYNHEYEIGVYSDVDGKEIDFYQNSYHPGGNSYYRENPEFSPAASILYSDNHKIRKITKTIDTVVTNRKFKLPDLIKIDVQGCELDILKGMPKCLAHATDLIVEMQYVQYNMGAPLVDDTMKYIVDNGFALIGNRFSNSQVNAPDSDYHFRRI